MSCQAKSTPQERAACPCPCAPMCSKKSVLFAIAAVPLALWAIKKLRG